MRWYTYLARFFGGAFLVNAIPHFVNGVSGRPFPSPFAHPPGQGMSPAVVNVLWGSLNIVIAHLLIMKVGTYDGRRFREVLPVAAGGLVMAILLARAFGRVFGGL